MISIEEDEFAEDLLEVSKKDCTEIMISIEKDEFETFERFRDLVIMIKKTFFLNDILIDIRMSSQVTNENIEMKNMKFTQKLSKKITIFMKIHSLNNQNFERFLDASSIIENFEKKI